MSGIDPAVEMIGDHSYRRVLAQVAVVGTVRQHHEVGREPVTTDVAALPGRGRPALRQGRRDGATSDRAASVVHAVRADEQDGIGRRRGCGIRRGRADG